MTESPVLLIVDDLYAERSVEYARLLAKLPEETNWRLAVVSTPADWLHVKDSLPCVGCLVIDMVLSEGGWTQDSVARIDAELCSLQFPALLVSKHFGDSKVHERLNLFVARIPFYQVVGWDELSSAADSGAYKIELGVRQVFGATGLSFKGGSEPIDVLHITDPHFGSASWANSNIIDLANRCKRLGMGGVDLLALTGDISQSGMPHEYEDAARFVKLLAAFGLAPTISDSRLDRGRVFLCPGNHDYNRPLALAGHLHSSAGTWSVAKAVNADFQDLSSFAHAPYRRFEEMHSVGGSILEKGFRICRRLSPWGLVIIEFDVELHEIPGYRGGLSESRISGRFEECLRSLVEVGGLENKLVIVLAHRCEVERWGFLSTQFGRFFQGLSGTPCLVFAGHEHRSEVVQVRSGNALVILGEPSVGGTESLSGEPVLNRVSVHRRDGVVLGISVYSFALTARSGWRFDSDRSQLHYSWKTAVWSRVGDMSEIIGVPVH